MNDQRGGEAGEQRIPAHPPMPDGYSGQEPQRFILMSPHMVAIGGLLAFFTVVLLVVVLPTSTYNPPPSDNWLPLSDSAAAGRATYLANGCVYCHSGFSRPQDTFTGRYYLYPRISEPGDYFGLDQAPNVLGSERTGPDLSQEGGNHPDDWHLAHYDNPRNAMPLSIMPRFSFWTDAELADMIAFNQAAGGKEAVLRYAAVTVGENLMRINGGMMEPALAFPDLVDELSQNGEYTAGGKGSDMSPWGLPWGLTWHINSFERSYWLTSAPLPVTQQNLVRGKEVYQARCAGCHGAQGDGKGPAAEFLMPKPFSFADQVMFPGASDGMMYHRILTAGPGTAMENFGTRLSVEDIWRLVLFLRTIPNGSLADPGTVPTVDMWQPWEPPDALLRYIDDHPIADGPGVIDQTESAPFEAAAHWLAPGLAAGDDPILVGGKLPMTRERLTDLIRAEYERLVERAWQDAVARGDPELPPREQIFSSEGVTFHAP